MKKIILLSALVLALASCSAPTPAETVPAVDSTSTKVDTACTPTVTTVVADTAKAK